MDMQSGIIAELQVWKLRANALLDIFRAAKVIVEAPYEIIEGPNSLISTYQLSVLRSAVSRYLLAANAEKEKVDEDQHRLRHVFLHEVLDELIADYISHTGRLPFETSLRDLMIWTHEQTIKAS